MESIVTPTESLDRGDREALAVRATSSTGTLSRTSSSAGAR